MRLPQFRVRTLAAVVAVAALLAWLVVNLARNKHVGTAVICGVAAAYGLGSMRRPLRFLMPLVVIWIVTPSVDHPGAIEILISGCYLAWIIAAPAGWISRSLARPGKPSSGGSELPEL